MALGVLLLSLPMALFYAVYGVALHGFNFGQALALYAMFGASIMTTFTLAHGLRFSDFR